MLNKSALFLIVVMWKKQDLIRDTEKCSSLCVSHLLLCQPYTTLLKPYSTCTSIFATTRTAYIYINIFILIRFNLFFFHHRVSILANGNLRIWNVTKPDAGLYTCVARNQFGVASSTGSITVKGISCFLFTFHHCLFCSSVSGDPDQ